MSNPAPLSDSAVTIQSSHVSHVNADETLIEFYQKIDQDYDLKIDLYANWNGFFDSVVLPGPMSDDLDDASGNNADISGANYVDFGHNGTQGPEHYLDLAKSTSSADNSGNGAYWAGCDDDNTSNANNGISNSHIQSVARGLVALFSHNPSLQTVGTSNVIVLEDDASGGLAEPDANFEIRISESQVREWMSTSGNNINLDSYGKQVFTQVQIRELLTACSDMGRYHIENTSYPTRPKKILGVNVSRSGLIETGHRVLALRASDMLQVRVNVYDTTGNIAQGATPNKRVWLVSLKQHPLGAYNSSGGYVS